ncbi:Rap GTPase activating protein domain [Trinorchestia longiramus]|nr:Rap GTPase activating protein domain [Trinorchestia longiramus]
MRLRRNRDERTVCDAMAVSRWSRMKRCDCGLPLLSITGGSLRALAGNRDMMVAADQHRHCLTYLQLCALPQVDGDGADAHSRRFRVESGDSNGEREESVYSSPNTPILENPEYQTRWYFKYFLGKLHQNYVGCVGEKVPVFLSVVLTDANNQCVPQYRAILWRKTILPPDPLTMQSQFYGAEIASFAMHGIPVPQSVLTHSFFLQIVSSFSQSSKVERYC